MSAVYHVVLSDSIWNSLGLSEVVVIVLVVVVVIVLVVVLLLSNSSSYHWLASASSGLQCFYSSSRTGQGQG